LTFALTGTDFSGAQVNQQVTANLLGNFMVANLSPGSYSLSLPAVPFATNPASALNIQSAINDGNTTGINLPIGNVQAKYIDIRDFTSTTFNRGFMVAVSPGATLQHWISAFGAWRDFSNLSVSLNSAATMLTIRATNAAGQVSTGSVAVTGSVRASEGNARLIRITSLPSEVTLTPVTTSSAASTLSNSSLVASSIPDGSTSNSQAEGEGAPSSARSVDAAMSQVNSSVQISPDLVSSIASSSTQTNSAAGYDSVYAQDLNEVLKKKS